jgi:hypothetical protein
MHTHIYTYIYIYIYIYIERERESERESVLNGYLVFLISFMEKKSSLS